AGTGVTGDLRYCITQANHTTGDNTIKFGVTGTITLNSALPDLSNTSGTTDIDGPGAKKLTVARNSAAGTPAFRIFTIDTGTTVDISSLTITGGLATQGGGLLDNGGTVSLTKVTVTNNQAVGAAGVAGVAGAVGNPGGGVGGNGGNALGGGLYLSGGSLVLNDDLVSNNIARGGAGGKGGDSFAYSASGVGGAGGTGGAGGSAAGGGAYAANGTLGLSHDTFELN